MAKMTMRKCRCIGILSALLATLGACTYEGQQSPLMRKLAWFSYLAGDDIRAACGPGAPAHYRLVYNAIYTEEVRAYDLAADPDSGGYALDVAVNGPALLNELIIDTDDVDLLKPWRPVRARRRVSDAELEAFEAALGESGAWGPAPVGAELASVDFYWILAACHGGRFRFNAFRWPSRRFQGLRFPQLLFAWDSTGIPVGTPRKIDLVTFYGSDQEEELTHYFHIRIKADGLWP